VIVQKKTNRVALLSIVMSPLLDHCRQNQWAGFDPYDGLGSRLFSALPLKKSRMARLVFIQAVKRSPINLRPFLLVPKGQNPKALALFISALVRFIKSGLYHDETSIHELVTTLIALRSCNESFYCWGYNFDWQSRYFMVFRHEPNIIATTFAGNALIDAFEMTGIPRYLQIAVSAGHFLLYGLNLMESESELCFSYTPVDKSRVHNANLLAAAYLARLFTKTAGNEFYRASLKAARFSVNRQNADGSWYYGEDISQRWIDHVHTGFNLTALNNFHLFMKNDLFAHELQKGYVYYLEHLFTPAGLPKYCHDQIYPIDIHAIAQSIITLVELAHLDRRSNEQADFIFKWATAHMKCKAGYFYYQKKRLLTIRTDYIRWSQAWMLYALAVLAEKSLPAGVDSR